MLTYSGNLQIGADTALAAGSDPLPPNDDNNQAVTWGYLVEGNCLVSNSGNLSLGEDAAAGDICLVRAVASADGHSDYSLEPAEVAVEAGTLSFATADKPAFVGTLHVAGSLSPNIPAASADDHGVGVTWENWRVDGACDLDAVTGRVDAGAVGDVCVVFVTATAPNYTPLELEITSLTVAEPGDLGAISAPTYNGKLTIRGYPLTVATEPTAEAGVNIHWGYRAVAKRNSHVHAPTEEICSVDAQSGAVTLGSGAIVGDSCEITVYASKAGYLEAWSATPVVLHVHDTFASLDWPTLLAGGAVGETIDLSGANGPVSTPAADDYAVTVASGNCTYNGTSDTLVFVDTEPCVLGVNATKDKYIDFAATFRVVPNPGTIFIAGANDAAKWSAYGTVTVGEAAVSAPSIGVTTPMGVSKTYTSLTSSVCSVSPTGAVTGHNDSGCRIRLVLSKTDYVDREYIYELTVATGTIRIAGDNDAQKWGVYESVTVGATTNAPTVGALTPETGVNRHYESNDTGACRVNSSTGAVTGVSVGTGNCEIILSLEADSGYADREYTYTISVGPGTIAVVGATDTAKWGSYGTVAVGGGPVSAPTIGATTPTAVTKTYTSLTSSVCTVSGTGAVTGHDDANCRIQLALAANHYTTRNHVYEFAVQPGTIAVAGVNDLLKWSRYGTVKVGAATSAPTIGSTTPATVTKTYTSLTSSACSVDAQGAVTGADDTNCQIKLVLSKDKYSNTEHTYSFTVQPGIIQVAGANDVAKWGSYGAIKVGENTSAPIIGSTTPTSVNKSYRVTGNAPGCTVSSLGVVGELPVVPTIVACNCSFQPTITKTRHITTPCPCNREPRRGSLGIRVRPEFR